MQGLISRLHSLEILNALAESSIVLTQLQHLVVAVSHELLQLKQLRVKVALLCALFFDLVMQLLYDVPALEQKLITWSRY
jgi:hypothetical protein